MATISPDASVEYRSHYGNVDVSYAGTEYSLTPNVVTEGIAVVVARLLAQRRTGRGLYVMDLGTGPGSFLAFLRSATPRDTRLMLHGVDADERVVDLAGANVSHAVNVSNFGNFAVSEPRIQEKSWDEVLGESYQYDVVAFNPPYLRRGDSVRPSFQDAPPDSMFVPDGESPTHYYRQVLP